MSRNCHKTDVVVAALRVFRVIVKMSNRHMMDAVLQTGVFKPVLELTLRESRRDNLLSASCQELFEFIRRVWMDNIIFFGVRLTNRVL